MCWLVLLTLLLISITFICHSFVLQLIINLVDMNDNFPTFPLSQYIVQGIAETVAIGTDIIQGISDGVLSNEHYESVIVGQQGSS